ncbi:hypothetical protein HA050_15615 [Iodobacter sp. HSC-16F04]|uniref:Uncharacterized protein n=1 Tax=Iodobacter violaceini TaxID=3044271 RepID=A0ABX0KUM6_9NEIS|nr:hypothetical protein [Iodobacter violacea]NHQ87546.1 hypothetical protein [Iodobacter violacea]
MTLRPLQHPQTQPGEIAMPFAPSVVLNNGQQCIPQHYLRYQHTLDSITQLASQIEFDQHTPIFAGQDHSGLYIQAGLIGRENYDRSNTLRPHKLVYGRKWRIDSDTPTSEIIQTVFLSIKKAREHEVRELLTLRNRAGKTSAALSNHHDLPLMGQQRTQLLRAAPVIADPAAYIRQQLAELRFAQRKIELVSVEIRSNQSYLIDLQLGEAPLARKLEGDFCEFDQLAITLILRLDQLHQLAYALMDELIAHSDRHVEEQFRFQGYPRFSRNNDLMVIANLSLQTRPYARDMANTSFERIFRASNYDVDASRAPALGSSELGRKNRQLIDGFTDLLGHLPQGYLAASPAHAVKTA